MTRTRSRPRPASRNAKRFAIAFAGLFLLVGLACLAAAAVPAWIDHRHARQVETGAVRAVGMVLTKSRESAGQVAVPGAGKTVFEYFVRYRFPVRGGTQAEGTARVTPEAWGMLEERGPIEVRYVEGDPATSAVPGQLAPHGGLSPLIFGVVGALFAAIGGFMLFIILRTR